MMINSRVFNWFLLGIALILPLSVSAQTLTVYTEDLPPYQIKKRNGEITGFSAELVRALFQRAELKANIRMVPWARAYNSALKQKNTLIISMVRTPEREGLFYWIGKVDKLEYYFYRLSNRQDIQLTNFEQAKKYRIGVGANSFEYEKLTYLGFPYVVSVPTYNQLMAMLKANRYDLFFSADRTFKGMLENSNSSPDSFDTAFHISSINQQMYIAMNKSSDPQLVKRLTTAYQQLKEAGEVERLAQIWLN